MECNKDEAIRAKSIAEKKMENNDFLGARKIALKAQNLYPELDNVNQLLCICEVHCAAQNKLVGSDKDWYGILQVEKLSDVLTLKKQYRRLALALHPDKNRFPGAEAAFKLICEAHTVLSDPVRKSSYDSKLRVLIKSSASATAQSHHANRSSQSSGQHNAAQNKSSNGFSNLNVHQATKPTSSGRQEVFWTRCPYCGISYQYLRQFLEKSLRCITCAKIFIGYEVSVGGTSMNSKASQSSAQGTTSKPDSSQAAASREAVSPKKYNSKTGIRKDKGSSVSDAGLQGTPSKKTVQRKPDAQTGSKAGVQEGIKNKGSKSKKADIRNSKSVDGDEGGSGNGGAINRKSDGQKNKTRKRSIKVAKESTENLDASCELDAEEVTKKSDATHGNRQQRPSRKRQRVSYSETDEHGVDSPNRKQGMNEGEEKVRKDVLGGKDTLRGNQNSFQDDDGYSKDESKRKETSNTKESSPEKDAVSDGEGGGAAGETDGTDADPNVCVCPDPEFNDFEGMREEKEFAANQFWALFDTLDGMPRFYARVKKVYHDPFNLVITWLEAVPIDKSFTKWVNNELPVSSGTFRFGDTEETSVRLSFSHKVLCEIGKKGSVLLYPRKGEIWALFKDWDVKWGSDPEIHNEFKFETVEVLSDFVGGTGIEVAYLDKVGGFTSLFQRCSQSEKSSFLIGPKELYRFSHRISYFTMTGSEKEGVPKGSFELDPAALPSNPENLYYPSKADNN